MSQIDVIVIGTGMGGGAAGYALASAGLRVLFLEKGLPQSRFNPKYQNDYAEAFVNEESRDKVYPESGRSILKVDSWRPVLGGGQGGSTTVYGGGLFRFHPDDFKNWPGLSYSDLQPYYEKCEELFHVRGTQDPLSPFKSKLQTPAPLTEAAQELFSFCESVGLHPFQAPIGYEDIPNCKQCFGFYCYTSCKKTAGNVFIEPALKSGNASVEYSVQALRLLPDEKKVTGVLCETPHGLKEY